MKKLFLFLILIAFQLNATTVYRLTNCVNNVNIRYKIQAAVDASTGTTPTNKDLVIVPDGDFVLDSNVAITNKFIDFKGSGSGFSKLHRREGVLKAVMESAAWKQMFLFTYTATTTACNIIFSGIDLIGQRPSLSTFILDGGSDAADIGIKLSGAYQFRITDCMIANFGEAGADIIHDDVLISGLFDNIRFYNNNKTSTALGLGYGAEMYGANLQWIADPGLGTGNRIYFENCRTSRARHALATGGCANYTARWCDFYNCSSQQGTRTLDGHEARGDNNGVNTFGVRSVEVYHNNLINLFNPKGTLISSGKSLDTLAEVAIAIKGGDVIIHDNYISGYRFPQAVGVTSVNLTFTMTAQPYGQSGVGTFTASPMTTKHSAAWTTTVTPSQYPFSGQNGYQSGRDFGPTDFTQPTCDLLAHTDGDCFVYNERFWTFTGSDGSVSNATYNYGLNSTNSNGIGFLVPERDFHEGHAKPNYSDYTYPNPLHYLLTP